MTDRYNGFTVILKEDYRDDEHGERLMNAIKCLTGILSVEPIVSDFNAVMAESRAKSDLRQRLWDVLK